MVRLTFGFLVQSGVKVTILIPGPRKTDFLRRAQGLVQRPVNTKGQSNFKGLVVRELERLRS